MAVNTATLDRSYTFRVFRSRSGDQQHAFVERIVALGSFDEHFCHSIVSLTRRLFAFETISKDAPRCIQLGGDPMPDQQTFEIAGKIGYD